MVTLTRQRATSIARRFHAIDSGLVPGCTRRIRRLFWAQARRVVAAYLATAWKAEPAGPPPAPEELLPEAEFYLLWRALAPFLLQATLRGGEMAGQLVGVSFWLENDPRVVRLLQDSAQRVKGIHDYSRRAIQQTLAEGVSRGYSMRQIVDGVVDDGFRGLRSVVRETYRGRAEAIAVTELATARNNAALERYGEGRVAEVFVRDGPGCGWAHHDDSDKANNTRRTVIAARQYPVAHPRCRRVVMPILER